VVWLEKEKQLLDWRLSLYLKLCQLARRIYRHKGRQTGFQIGCFSDVRYEQMTIEIYFNEGRLCQISKDLGNDKMLVDFLFDGWGYDEPGFAKFPYDEFIAVLARAKQELADYPLVPPLT
jgi:hypothetical protein